MTKGVIAYLRASKTDQISSEQALADQQASLSHWLAENRSEIVGQFIEIESERPDRPRLAEATEVCRQLGLPLVIVSLQSIGDGPSFSPRIASVPVIVLPQPPREPPRIIACPPGYQKEVCLHVGKMIEGRMPLYFCNSLDFALTKVKVFGSALQLGTAALAPSGPSTRLFDCIAPRTCAIVEQRDINLEGDFLDCLRITFDQAGVRRKGVALLRNLLDASGRIPLTFDP